MVREQAVILVRPDLEGVDLGPWLAPLGVPVPVELALGQVVAVPLVQLLAVHHQGLDPLLVPDRRLGGGREVCNWITRISEG